MKFLPPVMRGLWLGFLYPRVPYSDMNPPDQDLRPDFLTIRRNDAVS